MKEICTICGTRDNNITNEFFMENGNPKRYYKVCPNCLVEIYKNAINHFLDEDSKLVSSFLMSQYDKTYCDAKNATMINDLIVGDEIKLPEDTRIYEIFNESLDNENDKLA